jgi:cytochrome c biogenesis protein CcmG/thiol:disulfide interchange protein DsbE
MGMRWAIAVLAVTALAATAANYYMPWRTQNAPMQSSASIEGDGSGALTCAADAKPARFDFTMKDVAGKDVTLSQFKGKVILLDFWATWCGPCKVEIPGFVEFQEKYGRHGFQVVGVSVDDTAQQLLPYIEKLKMNYPVLLGLGHDDVQDAYGPLVGIPTTVLISRDGKICATHAGFTDKQTFEQEIRALL